MLSKTGPDLAAGLKAKLAGIAPPGGHTEAGGT
jgi:hypothetical protein